MYKRGCPPGPVAIPAHIIFLPSLVFPILSWFAGVFGLEEIRSRRHRGEVIVVGSAIILHELSISVTNIEGQNKLYIESPKRGTRKRTLSVITAIPFGFFSW